MNPTRITHIIIPLHVSNYLNIAKINCFENETRCLFLFTRLVLEKYIFTSFLILNGTALRSGRVTHLKLNISKTSFFLSSTCVEHISLSSGILKCLLKVGNSIKTCIINVDLGKAFITLQQMHSNFKPSCEIDRGHVLVPQKSFDTLNTLVTRKYRFSKIFFLSVLHEHTSVESL